jgi:hypothetical protein
VITTEDVAAGVNRTKLDALTVTFRFSETVLLQSRDIQAMAESYPTADAWANLKVTNFTLDDRELRQTYSAVISGWATLALMSSATSDSDAPASLLRRVTVTLKPGAVQVFTHPFL